MNNNLREELADLLTSGVVISTSAMGREYALVEADAILPIIAREVAKALTDAANAIDLEALADEWGNGDDAAWSAGNAASSVQIMLHDRAARIERAAK